MIQHHNSPSPTSSTRPILFLDIDGVMNTTDSCLRNRSGTVFALESVIALRWLIACLDPRIVITSTRRRDGLEAIRRLFAANELQPAADRIIGITPLLHNRDSDVLRTEEISRWLDAHPGEATRFAILDDAPIYSPLARSFVRTNPHHGLTFALARQTANLLRA